jgi:putative transposase
MSEKKKGRWSKEQKFKIALAALKGDKTIAQIAEEFRAHPNQVSEWKKQLLESGSDIFASTIAGHDKSVEKDRDELIQTIGHQTVKIDWLKKKLGITNSRSVDE